MKFEKFISDSWSREFAAFSGIAYNSTLLNMRVLGKCKTGYASDVADAIIWAVGGHINGIGVNQHPASIVGMSFAGRGPCPSFLQTAIDLAVNTHKATLFAAAGNDPMLRARDSFPANCAGVTSVGATDSSGQLAYYTAKGADVYLPGGSPEMGVPCVGPYLTVQQCMGTSMSVPHAGGLRALAPNAMFPWQFSSDNANQTGDVQASYANESSYLSDTHSNMVEGKTVVATWTTATGSFSRNTAYGENELLYYHVIVPNSYSVTFKWKRCTQDSGDSILFCCHSTNLGYSSWACPSTEDNRTMYSAYGTSSLLKKEGTFVRFRSNGDGLRTTTTNPYSFSWTTVCNTGYEVRNNQCEPKCTPGKFWTGSVCTQCPAGTFNTVGDAECESCLAGTYSSEGAAACTLCPAGEYSATAKSSSCSVCGAGTFSSSQSFECTGCMAGTFASSQRSANCSVCATCAAGQYEFTECNATTNTACAAAGALACTACAEGKYSDSGSASCTDVCPAGTFTFVASGK